MIDLKENEEPDATIASLWNKDYSSGQIAMELANKGYRLSRNAVVGRVFRMQKKGILNNKKPTIDKTSLVMKYIGKKFIPDRIVKSEMITAKKSRHGELRLINRDSGEGATIEKLSPCGCRWVMDFKRDGMAVFCNSTIHKRNFCEAHFNICYYIYTKAAKPVNYR